MGSRTRLGGGLGNLPGCEWSTVLKPGGYGVPCLGPAAVVAVNSVDVEATSSGVPVKGGEVS